MIKKTIIIKYKALKIIKKPKILIHILKHKNILSKNCNKNSNQSKQNKTKSMFKIINYKLSKILNQLTKQISIPLKVNKFHYNR